MDSRVSVISIIIKDEEAAVTVNELLHEFRNYIVGRMGIPYRQREVSIISVVLDAPGDVKNKKSIVAPEINICSIFLIIVRIVTTWLFGQMKLKSKCKKKL